MCVPLPAAPAHQQLGQGIKQERELGVKEDSSRADQLGKQVVGNPHTRCNSGLCANKLSLNPKIKTPILTASYQEKEKGLRHDSRSNDGNSLDFVESLLDV